MQAAIRETVHAYVNERMNIVEKVRERLDLHLHIEDPITINVVYPDAPPTPSSGAVKAIIKLGASNMPGTITVDTTNESATVTFVDDKDNVTTVPAGATATWSSSDETIATIAPDAANPLMGDVTPVAPGSCELAVSFGGTALEADGATPIPDPDPVSVTVDPGAAVGERLTLAE